MTKTWTDERVRLLRGLWADGVAGGVIARRLGPGFTRGMIAGKRHSLGLPPRNETAAKAAQARNGKRTALMCETPGSRATPELAARKAALAAALERMVKPLAGSNPRPWELREAGQCAFPVLGWGAGTMSCCEPVHGRGYCFGHCEILAGRSWPPEDAVDGRADRLEQAIVDALKDAADGRSEHETA
jgi:hypothetical protein